MNRFLLLTLTLVTALVAGRADACRFTKIQPTRSVMGYPVYDNSMLNLKTKSGKTLRAYNGFGAASMEACIRACAAERHCTSVTWRPHVKPNTCLKYADRDFATGKGVSLRIQTGFGRHTSVFVRWGGRRCNQ
jgi:hypothetical protein